MDTPMDDPGQLWWRLQKLSQKQGLSQWDLGDVTKQTEKARK